MKTDCSVIIGSMFGGIVVSFVTVLIFLPSVIGYETLFVLFLTILTIIVTVSLYRIIYLKEFNDLLNKYPEGVVAWAIDKGFLKSPEESPKTLSFSQKKEAFGLENVIRIKHLDVRDEYNRIVFKYRLGLEVYIRETKKTNKLIVIHHKEEIARLDEKEKKRVQIENLNRDFETIKSQYPLGMAVWMKNNQIESTISNNQKEKAKNEKNLIAQLEEKEKKKIKRLETQEKTRNELVLWKRKQAQFTQYCKDLRDIDFEMFSWRNYNIDVSINNIHSDDKYIVGQMFPYSYCSESNLDYTYFMEQSNNAANINQNNFPVADEIIHAIAEYVYDVNYIEPSSVYFCTTKEESRNNTYGFIYKQIINAFDEEITHNRIFFPFDNDSFSFKEWAKNINRRVLVIDVCTDNTRLIDVCKNIASKAVRKRPLFIYISLYKGYDRDEMMELIEEDRKKREEQEAIRKREENVHRELVEAVSSWKYLSNGFRYNHLFYYYPTTCDFEVTEEEWDNRYIVWNFKNDPAKGVSELEHEEALDEVIPMLKARLIDTFEEENLPFLSLVCLPASTKAKNEARYKEFSERLCQETGMGNGYEHIHFIRDGLSKNDPNNETGRSIQPKVAFDDWFENKYVLFFDDVVTKGNTMLRYKRKLEEAGVIVVGGICLGKTKHTRDEE